MLFGRLNIYFKTLEISTTQPLTTRKKMRIICLMDHPAADGREVMYDGQETTLRKW